MQKKKILFIFLGAIFCCVSFFVLLPSAAEATHCGPIETSYSQTQLDLCIGAVPITTPQVCDGVISASCQDGAGDPLGDYDFCWLSGQDYICYEVPSSSDLNAPSVSAWVDIPASGNPTTSDAIVMKAEANDALSNIKDIWIWVDLDRSGAFNTLPGSPEEKHCSFTATGSSKIKQCTFPIGTLSAGTYNFKARGDDFHGNQGFHPSQFSNDTFTVTASAGSPNACFTISPSSVGTAPFAVTLESSCSSGTINTWIWSFGDGSPQGSSSTENHIYTSPGTGPGNSYTATLLVQGPGGNDSTTRQIVVNPGAINADFSANPTSGNEPLAVQFTDASTPSPGQSNITDWDWDFGDCAVQPLNCTSTASSPSHTYISSGLYTVTLIVDDPGGTDFEIKTDYITVNSGGFNVNITSHASGSTVPLNSAVTFTGQVAVGGALNVTGCTLAVGGNPAGAMTFTAGNTGSECAAGDTCDMQGTYTFTVADPSVSVVVQCIDSGSNTVSDVITVDAGGGGGCSASPGCVAQNSCAGLGGSVVAGTCSGSDECCSVGGPPSVTVTFPNPLGATSFTDLINSIINFIFTVAVIVAPILLVVAGVMFMTAAGDPGRVATARRMLLWTIVGFAIILISKGLVSVLGAILGL